MEKIEDLYVTALVDLRSCLPKILIFLSLILMLLIFYPIISSSFEGVSLQLDTKKIPAKSLLNLLTFFFITVFILLTIREIWLLSISLSKLIVYFNSSSQEKFEEIKTRVNKLSNSFLILISFFIFLFIFNFLKEFILNLHPIIVNFISILLIIFLFVSLVFFALAISSEVEIKVIKIIEKMKGKK
jgi:hypothetical protein